jgi:hypothetical protein
VRPWHQGLRFPQPLFVHGIRVGISTTKQSLGTFMASGLQEYPLLQNKTAFVAIFHHKTKPLDGMKGIWQRKEWRFLGQR